MPSLKNNLYFQRPGNLTFVEFLILTLAAVKKFFFFIILHFYCLTSDKFLFRPFLWHILTEESNNKRKKNFYWSITCKVPKSSWCPFDKICLINLTFLMAAGATLSWGKVAFIFTYFLVLRTIKVKDGNWGINPFRFSDLRQMAANNEIKSQVLSRFFSPFCPKQVL